MTSPSHPCLVCGYELETAPPEQAIHMFIREAKWRGVSLTFVAEIEVCDKHILYIQDECPETLRLIEKVHASDS